MTHSTAGGKLKNPQTIRTSFMTSPLDSSNIRDIWDSPTHDKNCWIASTAQRLIGNEERVWPAQSASRQLPSEDP